MARPTFLVHILLVVLCPCFTQAQNAQSTHISIRIVECRTGHPVKSHWISVYTRGADALSESTRHGNHFQPPSFRIHSNRKGLAILEVENLPDVVFVVDSDANWAKLDVASILEHGGSESPGECVGRHATVPGVSPGEFVYWVYKPTFGERLEWLIPGI